jgi:hypothetical protein
MKFFEIFALPPGLSKKLISTSLEPKKRSASTVCAISCQITSVNIIIGNKRLKSDFRIHYAVMTDFACIYYQSPSLLQFQKELEDSEQSNNLKTLHVVSNIPENTQLRNIVDKVDSEYFRPVFKEFLARLQRGKHLEQYSFLDGKFLCDIDGTKFFGSNKVG